MPTLSRRVRDTIFVDNVDFKRVAREYLKSADAGPPGNLDEAMARAARWFGYPNLHALTQESAAAAPDDKSPPLSASSPAYRIHPLVTTGQAVPSAHQRIRA